MPRQPRLDVEGALHHVIVRGIERRRIFKDNKDRQRFVERLAELVKDTGATLYAWVLIPNHFHLLLRSGPSGLPTFMRRLLTGYAITFNRRYHRSGHLFQNRYKSFICEEEPYFVELVRYIHLNPLRSGVVNTIDKLDAYVWSGHAALLGKSSIPWQDCETVLMRFGQREQTARAAYRRFLEKGLSQGKRPDLTGGGLVRSAGGMDAVLRMRKEGEHVAADERILGTGEFVERLVERAERKRHRLSPSQRMERMEHIIRERCLLEGIDVETLAGGSRIRTISRIRAELAARIASEVGLSYAEIGRHLGVSTTRISKIIAEALHKLQ